MVVLVVGNEKVFLGVFFIYFFSICCVGNVFCWLGVVRFFYWVFCVVFGWYCWLCFVGCCRCIRLCFCWFSVVVYLLFYVGGFGYRFFLFGCGRRLGLGVVVCFWLGFVLVLYDSSSCGWNCVCWIVVSCVCVWW